jgi:hypothetical protein
MTIRQSLYLVACTALNALAFVAGLYLSPR